MHDTERVKDISVAYPELALAFLLQATLYYSQHISSRYRLLHPIHLLVRFH